VVKKLKSLDTQHIQQNKTLTIRHSRAWGAHL